MRKHLPYDPTKADSGILATPLSHQDIYFDKYFDDGAPEDDSLIKVVEGLLAELPERQRKVIEMCVLARMTYTEAGKRLKCSDQTARRETLRALAFLRSRFEASPWLSVIIDRKLIDLESPTGKELPKL